MKSRLRVSSKRDTSKSFRITTCATECLKISFRAYSCIAVDVDILVANQKFAKLFGKHVKWFHEKHVIDVSITNQTTVYLADGIGLLFTQLKQLEVVSSKLRFIKRQNFKSMPNLLDLRLDRNEIEMIFSDTFWDLGQLEWLSLSGNRIKILTEGMMIMSPKLLWFTANDNLLEYFDGSLFQNNPELEAITLRGNRLAIVRINITEFANMLFLDLRRNVCIDKLARSVKDVKAMEKIAEKIDRDC